MYQEIYILEAEEYIYLCGRRIYIYFCGQIYFEDDEGSGGFSLLDRRSPPDPRGVSRLTGIPIIRKQAAVTVLGVVYFPQ